LHGRCLTTSNHVSAALPYKYADQLVVLWASVPAKGIPADWTSWPTIQDWRKQSSRALGATTQDVLRLILASGVKLAGTGIALGLVASILVMRLVRHLLFGVSPTDPITTLVVSVTLLLAALAASYFPARRAAHMEPLASIKHE
jgi:hypothetical protein